jgi:hypothetical protein
VLVIFQTYSYFLVDSLKKDGFKIPFYPYPLYAFIQRQFIKRTFFFSVHVRPDGSSLSCKYFIIFKQRLTDEAEMTEGFKTLLKDLHELMSNIKDSSVMLRRGNDVAETNIPTAKGGSNVATKNIPTAKDVVPDRKHRKTTATAKESGNKSSRCRDGKISTDSEASTVPSVTLREQPSNPSKNRGTEYKKKSSSCVNAPLHSSSPKSSSPVFDNDPCNAYTTQFDSDISDVEYDFSEGKQERTAELRNESSTSSKPRYDYCASAWLLHVLTVVLFLFI